MRMNQHGATDMIVFAFLLFVLAAGAAVAILFVDSGASDVASSDASQNQTEAGSTNLTASEPRTETFSAELRTESTTWSQGVYDSFVDGCMSTAVTAESGIDRETGLIYCTCAAAGVEALYPTDEILLREEQEWAINGLPPDVDKVTEECAAVAGLF